MAQKTNGEADSYAKNEMDSGFKVGTAAACEPVADCTLHIAYIPALGTWHFVHFDILTYTRVNSYWPPDRRSWRLKNGVRYAVTRRDNSNDAVLVSR